MKPIRVLHVVGGMNMGGVETWLMHLVRHIDRNKFLMDFLVHTQQPCIYDEELRDMGSKIIPCIAPSKPWRYAINFRRILKKYGPYDIIHSHVHHYSGFVLCLARLAGIPVRIAHSHNDTSMNDENANIIRKAYLRLMEYLIRKESTNGIACSRKAAISLYGADWQNNPKWQLLYCGIDLEPFKQVVDCSKIRSEFGIPEDALVIGHVGRFNEQKNHDFLIDIAFELEKRKPGMRLILIGDGLLRTEIADKAATMGLKDKVVFAGLRPDVPRLMKGVMDVFVFPSLYEGLGLVLLEAQAAKLPCVISNVIPDEVDVVKNLITRINLTEGPCRWADTILNIGNCINEEKNLKSVHNMEKTHFDIDYSSNSIQRLYGKSIFHHT